MKNVTNDLSRFVPNVSLVKMRVTKNAYSRR